MGRKSSAGAPHTEALEERWLICSASQPYAQETLCACLITLCPGLDGGHCPSPPSFLLFIRLHIIHT